MKTEDEKLLAERQRELEEAVRNAKGLAAVFIAATGEFAAAWIGSHVSDTVKREHAHTLSLGEKLKELKADTVKAQGGRAGGDGRGASETALGVPHRRPARRQGLQQFL